jgi:hypothetical protein
VAVLTAQKVHQLARNIEAEELLGRTNAGIELARDQKAASNAQTANEAAIKQTATDREDERNRLVAKLAEPGPDLAAIATDGRKLAVGVMRTGTAWGRAAAEAALAGPDEVVLDYLKNGWRTAKEQDDRSYVERLAEESASPEVRAAAESALVGDAAVVAAFVDNGQYQVASQPMRVGIAQIISEAGPVLAETGHAALNSGDPKKYSEFLTKTQFTARTQDERVKAAQLVSVGSPEVRSAARIALEGSPKTLHSFIVAGQYTAARKDRLTATHVAQVKKLIADAAQVAARAHQDAALAQKVAAEARKAATEANDWALKAQASANDAAAYAEEADQYAKEAEASAASAAASAATARDASNSANEAAKYAALSATDATLSSEVAQASASIAWTAADQARQSSLSAGADAEGALKAATEAFTISVKKYREEEEARRKAAIEAKQKAMESPGYQAAMQYRCGQTAIPCDPAGFARWCQHNDIACELLSYAPAITDALNTGSDIVMELTGLSEYDTCLENKDFESCWELGADVLIGSKLKILENVYDKLKILKRVCSVSGAKSSGMTVMSLAASADDIPCLTHDVPGLPRSVDEIVNSGGCDVCARKIRESLGGGKIVTIRPIDEFYLPKYRDKDAGWNFHVVVVHEGRVYDAWTPRGGESVADYKSRWMRHGIIDFGF